jgi:transcriptional regulator with XRE-family HTH domain
VPVSSPASERATRREVARLIAARRARLGWSQSELAKRADVDRSTVARWEHGMTMPYTTLVHLARALQCSPRQLLPRK